MKYQIEVMWNREFHYVSWGNPKEDLKQARVMARNLELSGDGARVKAVRIIDEDGRMIPMTGRS